jgi:hypothetical protein
MLFAGTSGARKRLIMQRSSSINEIFLSKTEIQKDKGVSAMCSTHVLRQKKVLYTVLFVVIFAFVLAACGTRSSSTATGSTSTTPASIPTSGTVPGYTTTYGCPSDVVVSTAPAAPNVTVEPKQGNTVINAHRGDVIEIQMPFGVAWQGPTTSQGVLQLQQPAGYVWKPANACIWRFVAMGTGRVALDFSGSAICKKVSLCVPSEVDATFTITVD